MRVITLTETHWTLIKGDLCVFVEGRQNEYFDAYEVTAIYHLGREATRLDDTYEDRPILFEDQQDAIDMSKELLEQMYQMRYGDDA